MFKKWLALFKKDNLMDHAYQRSFDMLALTHDMFIEAKESLRHREDNEININLKDQDLEVNAYERQVRRHVFNHLVVSGPEVLPSGLGLISIIIDIERIGDYTKNIVELAVEHPGKLDGGVYEKEMKRIEEMIEKEFMETRDCFKEGNPDMARDLLERFGWINKACDDMLYGLVREDDPSIRPGDAVTLAFYSRCLKRINSHLRNIITSVVNPFDQIGFNPKSPKEDI